MSEIRKWMPPWIGLRALAVELCPPDRTLNSFKWELRRILDDAGVPRRKSKRFKGKGRYFLADLRAHAPFLLETWAEIHEARIRPAA